MLTFQRDLAKGSGEYLVPLPKTDHQKLTYTPANLEIVKHPDSTYRQRSLLIIATLLLMMF